MMFCQFLCLLYVWNQVYVDIEQCYGNLIDIYHLHLKTKEKSAHFRAIEIDLANNHCFILIIKFVTNGIVLSSR